MTTITHNNTVKYIHKEPKQTVNGLRVKTDAFKNLVLAANKRNVPFYDLINEAIEAKFGVNDGN